MIKLILVRHGETVWNKQRRIQGGGSDVELSEAGRKQAERLGLSLKEVEFSAIYSSPLKRALDTAKPIADYHQLGIQVDPDLKELEVGELEGVDIAELGTNFSRFLLRWQHEGGWEKMPGGESIDDLGDRVGAYLQRIIGKHKQEAVVVVSHFFVTVVIICKALGVPLTQMERIRVQNASVSIIDFRDRRPCLMSLSDICHLRES